MIEDKSLNTMREILLLLTLLSSLLFYTSCTSIKTLVINIEQPAELNFPKNITKIGIINNAVSQPENLGHLTETYTENGTITTEKTIVKSDSNNILLTNALFNALIDINYFDSVSVYKYPLRSDTSYLNVYEIDSDKVKQLCEETNSDAILSLDRFIVSSYLHNEFYDIDINMKYLDLKINALFRLYSKSGEAISPLLNMSDSIFWTAAYNQSECISEKDIPTREDAVKQAIIYTAEKFGATIVPSWVEEPRFYYGDIKKANKEMANNNWIAARNLWLKTFEDLPESKKKGRLANNIALTYELDDDLKNALKWTKIAQELFFKFSKTRFDMKDIEMSKDYETKLQKRYNDFKLLDMQNTTKNEIN